MTGTVKLGATSWHDVDVATATDVTTRVAVAVDVVSDATTDVASTDDAITSAYELAVDLGGAAVDVGPRASSRLPNSLKLRRGRARRMRGSGSGRSARVAYGTNELPGPPIWPIELASTSSPPSAGGISASSDSAERTRKLRNSCSSGVRSLRKWRELDDSRLKSSSVSSSSSSLSYV